MFRRKKTNIMTTKVTFVDLGSPPHALFPDLRSLINELDIDGRAHKNAVNDQADPSASEASAAEREITDRCERGIEEIRTHLMEIHRRADGVIVEHTPQPVAFDHTDPKATTAVAEVHADIEDAWNRGRDELTEVYTRRLRALTNLNFFKARNGLSRSAEYSDNVPLQVVTLVVIFGVETIVNGLLFGQVNERGLIGGWGLAAIISTINVGMGLLLGLVGLRLMFHKNWVARTVGGLFVILIVPAALFWNAAVSVYRDLAERMLATSEQLRGIERSIQTVGSEPENIRELFVEALGRVLELSIEFSSIEGIALFILGLFIVFIATLKGRSGFTDAYWGYKTVDRKFRVSEDDWSAARDDYSDEISDIVAEVVSDVELDGSRERDNLVTLQKVFDAIKVREQEAAASRKSWDAVHESLLKRYREEYLKVRGNEAEPPSHFSNVPKITAAALPGYTPIKTRDDVINQDQKNRQHRQSIITAIHNLRAQHISDRETHLRTVINNAKKRLDEERGATVADIAEPDAGEETGFEPQ